MKVQKGIILETNRQCWMVLDDDYLPIDPISKYLNYLDSLERSPNTLAVYAHNLKLYWEFLKDKQLDWTQIDLENLADFIQGKRKKKNDIIC
jgi:site-specific recombinase XerD